MVVLPKPCGLSCRLLLQKAANIPFWKFSISLGNREAFITALIGPPFGLSGRVKVSALSGETAHLIGLKKAVLCLKNEKNEGAEKEFIIEEVFSSPLSVKFKGIDSPEAARTLLGAEIIVSREQAAPLDEGEFYIEDLRGLEVFAKGSQVGIISDIIEGGGGFLAEIQLLQREKQTEEKETAEKRLVPFRNEFFGLIDTKKGRAELLHTWILE